MGQNSQIIIYKTNQSAVASRREMAKIPAVMDALEPIEKAVFLASTSKLILEYSGNELAIELSSVLKWICKDVGYRITDESETQYLIIRTSEILKRYYSNLTLKDFRMAFEMSITGELDDFLPKGRDGQPDKNHYQQFNAEYVCKILNAYKNRRAWILKKAREAMPRPEPKQDPEQNRYYRNQTRKDCIKAFLCYKHTGRLPKMSPISEMLCYDLLASVGLADDVVITSYEQERILRQTIYDYSRRGMAGAVERLKREGTGARELEYGSFVLARKKALIAAFDIMIYDETQITDYIKFE